MLNNRLAGVQPEERSTEEKRREKKNTAVAIAPVLSKEKDSQKGFEITIDQQTGMPKAVRI